MPYAGLDRNARDAEFLAAALNACAKEVTAWEARGQGGGRERVGSALFCAPALSLLSGWSRRELDPGTSRFLGPVLLFAWRELDGCNRMKRNMLRGSPVAQR